MKNKEKEILTFFLHVLYQATIFFVALFSSLFIFGGNQQFFISKSGDNLINSGDSDLIVCVNRNKDNVDPDFWSNISYENTKDEPYKYSASRYVTTKYNELDLTVFDVPYYNNSSYSYNHIYGENVWNKLKSGYIVLSSDLYRKLGFNPGDNMTITLGNKTKSFEVIGMCFGAINGERNNTGSIFAGTFGYFAVVSQEDLNDITISSFFKTISKYFEKSAVIEREIKKWINTEGFDSGTAKFSCKAIQERYKLYTTINQRLPLCMSFGIVLLIIAIVLLIQFISDYVKYFFENKFLLYSLPIISLLLFFGLLFLFSKITPTLFGVKFLFAYSGAFVFPVAFGLFTCMTTILGALRKEKAIENHLDERPSYPEGKKTIWIMNHYATTPDNGPLPRHYYLAKRFAKEGYRVIIFASNQLHATGTEVAVKKGHFTEVNVDDDIIFAFLKTYRYKGNGIKRIINMISFYFAILRSWDGVALKYGLPKVIIGSSAHLLTCVAAHKIAKKHDIPYITEVRDLWPEELFTVGKVKEKSLFGKMLSRMERNIYIHSDAIVFTKEGDVDHIKEMKWDKGQGGKINLEKCYYVNNGVDFDEWNQNIKENKYDIREKGSKKFYVGYAGSIRPMNSVDFIIEAAELLKNNESIVFCIAGSGSLLEDMKKLVEEKKLTNVKFTGYLDKKFVPSFLSQMDLNILVYSNSMYNWSRGNSSNKLFEYMASGKPIISTVKMGYSLINRYKCGIELDEYTPKNLAEAVEMFKKMNKQEYSEYCNNAKKASKDFDFDKLSSTYLSIIDKVIK
ncbi:MAG: glycosyltransferase family 4 protein [Bacilli bacterium]|nr:glycosyltransferase family 4 protein [Bacilli bacterium]